MSTPAWFSVRGRAAYLPRWETLVVADLHLGRGATSNVEFPLGAVDELLDRLGEHLDAVDPGTVIVAGDLLHSFSDFPTTAEEGLDRLRRRVRDAGATLVAIEGNHDAFLGSILDPVESHAFDDGTVVCHGHVEPPEDGDRYVIGHDHPAISIEGERRPCFLWGEGAYRGADVLALPAFTELAAGVEVNGLRGPEVQSPLLSDLDSFRPIVYDRDADEPLVFPPLASLREHL